MANPGHVSIRCFTHCVQSYRFTFLVQEGHCCNRNYQNPCGDLRCNFGFLLVQSGAGIWLHQQGQSAKESWQVQQGWEGHLRLSPPKPVRGRWQAGCVQEWSMSRPWKWLSSLVITYLCQSWTGLTPQPLPQVCKSGEGRSIVSKLRTETAQLDNCSIACL